MIPSAIAHPAIGVRGMGRSSQNGGSIVARRRAIPRSGFHRMLAGDGPLTESWSVPRAPRGTLGLEVLVRIPLLLAAAAVACSPVKEGPVVCVDLILDGCYPAWVCEWPSGEAAWVLDHGYTTVYACPEEPEACDTFIADQCPFDEQGDPREDPDFPG